MSCLVTSQAVALFVTSSAPYVLAPISMDCPIYQRFWIGMCLGSGSSTTLESLKAFSVIFGQHNIWQAANPTISE